MAATTSLTIDDFERLPAEQLENHELVDGELVSMPTATYEHQWIRDSLLITAGSIVRERGLGRLLAELAYDFGGNVHVPDVSFFGLEKVPLVQPKTWVQRFVPDLAIEIVSPSDTASALWRKKDRYRACGTFEVWVVFPESREVSIFAEGGDRILRGSAELSTGLIPGFRMAVDELFQGF
jgi:Uma2 family endonuclease